MIGLGAWAVVAVDGADGRQMGREQAFLCWQREDRGQPTAPRKRLRGMIELKTRAISAASRLASCAAIVSDAR
jgi:hypothetical protein